MLVYMGSLCARCLLAASWVNVRCGLLVQVSPHLLQLRILRQNHGLCAGCSTTTTKKHSSAVRVESYPWVELGAIAIIELLRSVQGTECTLLDHRCGTSAAGSSSKFSSAMLKLGYGDHSRSEACLGTKLVNHISIVCRIPSDCVQYLGILKEDDQI